MKKASLLLSVFLICVALHAQTPPTDVKINDLNVPTAPAFVLMDQSPASIEKPTNPKALTVSLFNLLQGGAVEFTPYWFKNHPAYKFSDYFKKVSPISETFALSAASFKKDTISMVAGGFRTQLLRLYSAKAQKESRRIEDSVAPILLADLNLKALDSLKLAITAMKSKPVLNIELAGAYMGQATSFKSLAAVKTGAWLNIRWTPYKFPLDIMGLARYSRAVAPAKTGQDSVFFDYGLSLAYQEKNFDISFEFVNRRDIHAKSDYHRLALVANYQVTDGIIIVASAGKDFSAVNNVLAVFGVKFGLSKEKATL